MNLADVEAEFINCIRSGGAAREEVFTFIEANVARHFNQGVQGLKYYEKFLTIVRRANVPDAVAEYQNRFISLCDQRLLEPIQEEGIYVELLGRVKRRTTVEVAREFLAKNHNALCSLLSGLRKEKK